MKKFKTEILIRNNRLEKMENAGIKVHYSTLNDADYITELKAKIIEEANEVALTNSKKDLTEEIADVLEVIDHLKAIYNIDDNELDTVKATKLEKLGGFEKRIKTHYVEIADDNKNELDYYLAHREKYPEIID